MTEAEAPGVDDTGNSGFFDDLVAGAFSDALENLAEAVKEAVSVATASIASMWVLIGTPDLISTGEQETLVVPGQSDPDSGELIELMNAIAGIGLVVCVVSLIWLAMLVGASVRRGEGALHVGRGGAILAGAVLISASASIAGAFIPEAPHEDVAGATLFLQSSLWFYTAAVAAIAVIIGGIRMAWFARAEEGKELVKGLLTLLVVAGFGVAGTQMLVTLTDSFSVWILARAIDCDVSRPETDCFADSMHTLLPFASFAIGPILTIVLGLIAILVSAFQVVLMVARSGMLVILVGVLPISAAATNTEMGKAWFKRSIGWLLAFILYKPAAAIVYAAAFRLMATDVFDHGGDGLIAVLTGIMLMVLALFALKALMEFVTPLVSAAGAGSGGAAAAAAMSAMPTGAAQLAGLLKGSGSSSTPDASSSNTPNTPSPNATGAADGGSGPAGAQGVGGASTSGGPNGAETADASGGAGKAAAGAKTGAPVPAGAGAAGAGGGAAGGATGAGAAAGGGAAAAGAAAGPVGIAAGAALDVATKVGEAAAGAAQAIGQESAGQQQEEGPSGSR